MVNADRVGRVDAAQVRVNLRAPVRRALFAGAESTWIYLAMLLLAGWMRFDQSLSLASVFALYYGGMLIARRLARVKRDWRLAQGAVFVGGFIFLLFVLRVDLYRGYPLYDWSWLGRYVIHVFTLADGITSEHLATVTLLFAFARGLRYASRPLTLWFVGYQFRLTVVYLFFILIGASAIHNPDFSRGVFLFFALWIISIALARVEEAGREHALGWKWAITFIGATALVIALGFGLSAVFENGGLALLGTLLSPVAYVVFFAAGLLLFPFVVLAGLVSELLGPIIRALIVRFQEFRLALPSPVNTSPLPNPASLEWLQWLVPLARTGLLLAVFALIALWVVRQLNRRMFKYESENFVLEHAPLQSTARGTKAKAHKTDLTREGEIHAENIRRLYAAFLQRASRAGFARQEAETPLEFLSRASNEWATVESELDTITRAYIAVHYAEHHADDSEVNQARAAWERARPVIIKPDAKKAPRHS